MTYEIIIFTDLFGRNIHIKTLGAYRIASELRLHGYTVKVIDYVTELIQNPELFKKLLDNLIGPNTLFVGWSSTFFGDAATDNKAQRVRPTGMYPASKEVFVHWLEYIKQIAPQVKIVYGGHYAKRIDLISNIDYAVVGIADKMVVDLASHLKHKTSLKYRPSPNNTYKIIDYDHLGAAYDFNTGWTKFEDTDHVEPGETIVIETSRGCMFKCKFCNFPLLGRKKTDPLYHRNEECLAREIQYNWEKYKINRYIIVDDTFNETNAKIESVIRARDIAKVDLEVTSYLRLDLLNRFPEQLALCKELGFKAAFFGVESFNDKSAASIGKGMPSAKVKEMLHKVKDVFGEKFVTQISLIIGLPYETRETLADSMEWVLSKDSPINHYFLNALKLYPNENGSEFDKNYANYGYTWDKINQWSNSTWDYAQTEELCRYYNELGYNSGKQKLGNFGIFGLASCGFSIDELATVSLKDLDSFQVRKMSKKLYNNYVNTLLEYENIIL
jgi:radical SAM superfamily enzyme YgiQ (UPF0313 family)